MCVFTWGRSGCGEGAKVIEALRYSGLLQNAARTAAQNRGS